METADPTADDRYQVVVGPVAGRESRFEYAIARARPLSEMLPEIERRHPQGAARLAEQLPADFELWDPVADLTGPACTAEQARQLALAWLRIVGGIDPEAVEMRVYESDGAARRVQGPAIGYGRLPRARFGSVQRLPRRWRPWGAR